MVRVHSTVLGLSAAAATVASASSLSSLPSYDLPTFDYPSLTTGDAPQRLLEALTTDGMVALKNIPNYANLRERYLREAVQCAAIKGSDDPFVSRKLFADGTKRMTISTNAGRELRGSAAETDTACPGFRELYEEFSQTVEHAVNSFGAALDQTAFKASDGHTTISSRQLVSEAVRLDHFHAYEAAPVASGSTHRQLEELSLPLHEDHGLFIAMAAPKYFEVEANGRSLVERELAADASGLIIQTPSGQRVRPVLNGEELVVMMGTGASRWLQTSHKLPAVLHGMKMPEPLTGRSLRAWFGKMTLLPAYQRMLETNTPFEAHVNATTRQLLTNEASQLKSVGCATDRQLVESESSCTFRECKLKAGEAEVYEPCSKLCNIQGHPEETELCSKVCHCKPASSPGTSCWMLCVATLPEAKCAMRDQMCDGQAVSCGSAPQAPGFPPQTPQTAPGFPASTPAGTPAQVAPGLPKPTSPAPGSPPAPVAPGLPKPTIPAPGSPPQVASGFPAANESGSMSGTGPGTVFPPTDSKTPSSASTSKTTTAPNGAAKPTSEKSAANAMVASTLAAGSVVVAYLLG